MTILDRREVYRPFEYQEANDYCVRQQQAHWLPKEVSMAGDIQDWKVLLTDAERNVVGTILKGFTQIEVIVNDYWSRRITKWFPKPEIIALATTLGSFEVIHQQAYAYLNESLGLDDFSAFLEEPTAKSKIDALISLPGDTPQEIAKSLAVFSAFTEGVQIFSSFAVLMNFSRFNKLKGVGQIVAFSIRDESLHSEVGCWLFKQLLIEFPMLRTKELIDTIYDGAINTIKLEDDFIDKVFELGPIQGMDPIDLKQFIRYRCNTKLGDLGLESYYAIENKDDIPILDWFDYLSSGIEHQDFFAGRVTSYSRAVVDFSSMYDEES